MARKQWLRRANQRAVPPSQRPLVPLPARASRNNLNYIRGLRDCNKRFQFR